MDRLQAALGGSTNRPACLNMRSSLAIKEGADGNNDRKLNNWWPRALSRESGDNVLQIHVSLTLGGVGICQPNSGLRKHYDNSKVYHDASCGYCIPEVETTLSSDTLLLTYKSTKSEG
jgi:hypothetical protein